MEIVDSTKKKRGYHDHFMNTVHPVHTYHLRLDTVLHQKFNQYFMMTKHLRQTHTQTQLNVRYSHF